jgi:hypothetical protein
MAAILNSCLDIKSSYLTFSFEQLMKLHRIEKADPVQRITVSVRGSTLDLLDKYRLFYKQIYGDEIERSQMVNDILKEFMNEDKAFLKAAPHLVIPENVVPSANEPSSS